MLPQYALCRAIKERCPLTPVVITGDGADELFGGYRRMEEYDAQYSDIFEELVLYHLPRLDKMAMAHTLELRSPFLHRKVIEGAMSLSYQSRINKKFLKEIFCDIIPLHIIDRPKKALKSDQVLHDKMWRHTLIRKFKEEIANEYQRRR
jgi:asparagine synthase (glutamine-hydrolysing)